MKAIAVMLLCVLAVAQDVGPSTGTSVAAYVVKVTSDPSPCSEGQMWENTTNHTLNICLNGGTVTVGTTSGAATLGANTYTGTQVAPEVDTNGNATGAVTVKGISSGTGRKLTVADNAADSTLVMANAGTGLVRDDNSAGVMTESIAELSGDCVTSGSNVVACKKAYQYSQPSSTPAQNSTYYLGINGGSSTTTANKATHYFTQACTLIEVCYYMQIDTTLNTAAENVTFEVGLGGNGSAFSGAMTDTILTLPTNARSGKTCAVVNDAISANSSVIIQMSTPNPWTTPPTGVYFSARLVCR